MKKIYTKYDYIYIYSKLGVITTTFAVVSISLSLFLGFIVTLAGHAHPDLSSRICFVLFVLNLPFVFQKVKRYQAIQNKLKKKHPDGTEDDPTSQITLPNRKQLWGGTILLAILAFTILFLCVLMLWLMISYYENIFLILFIFLGSLSLPVLAVMVTYIRLLSFTVNNPT